MGRARRAMSNSLYLSLDWLTATLLGYLFWIVAGKLLLPAELGVYSTIFALAFFITQFDSLGINSAISKLIPEYEAKGQRERVIGSVWWSFKVSLLINAALAILLLVLSPVISGTGYLGMDQTLLLSASLVVISLYALSSNILFSFQKMRSLFLSNFAANAMKVALAVPLIAAGFSYAGAVLGFLVSALAVTLYRILKFPRGAGVVDRKTLWFYAIPAFIGTAGGAMINQGSILSLGLFRPMADVGVFTIAFILTSVIRVVPQSIAGAIFPMTSEQWATNQKENLRTLVRHSVRYSMLLTLPLIFTIVVFFKDILLVMATSSYVSSYGVVLLLSAAFFLIGVGTNFANILYTTGNVDDNRNSIVLSGASNLVLSFLLIPTFGMIGASAAFFFSGVVLLVTSWVWSKQRIKFTIGVSSIAKVLVASAFYLLFVFTARALMPFNATPFYILNIAVVAVTGGIIYVAALLSLRFFEKMDVKLLDELIEKAPGRVQPIMRRFRSILSKNLSTDS